MMKTSRGMVSCLVSVLFGFWVGAILPSYAEETAEPLPDGFVDLGKVAPTIHFELRYCTAHNFVGAPIDGYIKPRAILSKEAAEALIKVEDELRSFGLGLKVFDAYRPQRAVDHFVRWAKDLDDVRMKQEFYPRVEKKDLFKEEYIADRSSHTRGSTVDVTLVDAEGNELDMGSAFDFFDPKSWPLDASMTASQRAHRMLLRQVMTKHGFKPYPREWWHFTLVDEPFPDTYFDFPVQ